jgi:hypothetical protein
MSELEPGDKRSAFLGMIVTTVILFIFAFGIVQWTNSQFAGAESHGETTTKH